MNAIAEHVLNTYKKELINRQQIPHEGHLFHVVASWEISDGRIYYEVFDSMSMNTYGIYKEVKK